MILLPTERKMPREVWQSLHGNKELYRETVKLYEEYVCQSLDLAFMLTFIP